MFFRIQRAALGEASNRLEQAVESGRPLVIPLVRPGSPAGSALMDPNESVVLSETSEALGADILFVADRREFESLVSEVFAHFDRLNGGAPPSAVIGIGPGRKKLWVLNGPPEGEVESYLEFLMEVSGRIANGRTPVGWESEVSLSEDLSVIGTILRALGLTL